MFDIRLPIGILFVLLGALLTLFGFTSGAEIYRAHSLGINLNLIWGAVMMVFGAIALVLVKTGQR